MKLKEINLMNVFLCFSVVLIHLTASPVTSLRHDSIWYLLFFVINKFLTFAVPGFIFLSGFKLHNKYKDNPIDIKKFYSGRFKKIVIPYIVAFSIYFVFYKFLNMVQFNEFLPALLLGTLAAHFYYIIIALQFYSIFPLLNKLFQKYDKVLLILSLISTFIFNQFVHFAYSDRFFGTYIFYFVLGMFLSKINASIKQKHLVIFSALFIPLTLIHVYFSYKMSLGGFWYKPSGIGQVIYVSLACIVIYDLCLYLKSTKLEKVVNFIEPHTFYIFLYHILFMNILDFVVYPFFNLSIKYKFLISSIIIFFIILGYCYIKNYFQKKKLSD